MLSLKAMGRRALRAAGGALLRAASTPGFDTTGGGRRLLGWTPSGASINALMSGSAATLRRQSRDIARKDAWAVAGVRAYRDSAIGSGIKPRSRHPDDDMRVAIQALWEHWQQHSDATGVLGFYGQQALAVQAKKEGGECFARLRPRRTRDGLPVPLQVQLIEPEQVPEDRTMRLSPTRVVRQGIEFDNLGRRTAYEMYREHPGEQMLSARGSELVRVPARSVIHLFEPMRPGQIRGYPDLAPVMLRLYEFNQYEDAEVVRQKLHAMLTGFITEQVDADGLGVTSGTKVDDPDPGAGEYELVKHEPGTYMKLKPGESVEHPTVPGPGGGYNDFTRWVLHAVAGGLGVTYSQLTGDLTDVNFSSIRAGLIDHRRGVKLFQQCIFNHQFNQPIWRAWINAAVLSGALPVSLDEFRADPTPFYAVKWVPDGWEWVDPKKEAEATILAVRAGLTSRARAVAERGEDIEQIDEEIAADRDRADGKGLTFDSDARARRAAAAAPGEADDDDDSEDDETRAA